MKFFERLRLYDKIARISEIGRRYFVMNSFDGVLTIIGILVGAYFSGIATPYTIIFTGISASIAMAISGIWGTFLTEEAERKKKMNELSRHTLRDMGLTKIGKAQRMASVVVSLIDGLAPFLSSFIVILPFFFTTYLGIKGAYLLSIVIALCLLVLLGGFLGHISKENKFTSGLKMLLAGIVCVVIIFLIGLGHKTL